MADKKMMVNVPLYEQHSLINTTFPVFLPYIPELALDKNGFDAHIKTLLPAKAAAPAPDVDLGFVDTKKHDSSSAAPTEKANDKSLFMTGLLSGLDTVPSLDSRDGKMLTENSDVAYRNSGEALVDLFYELEDVISAARLKTVLEAAWSKDADATLKIIWNARSIHLGKSSRITFYRAVGWLAQEHPLTLIANLPFLVRPVVQKKVPKVDGKTAEDVEIIDAKDADSDFEMVGVDENTEGEEELAGQPMLKRLKLDEGAQLTEFDVKYGVSHGYWKDLLNILALAANDELKVDGNPKEILNIAKPSDKPYERDWTAGRKKALQKERHDRVVDKLHTDKNYQALHLTIARLFAQQLKLDLARLVVGRKAETKHITLAAKWAPTHKGMHDQHTCIVSTIAELLHPFGKACPDTVDLADRELYLKHARVAYQSQTLSPLRKHLQIVERDITAETFDKINYERVPSLAMKQYTALFATKDFDHFDKYIEKVAAGTKKISGAVLLPSTLVRAVNSPPFGKHTKSANAMVQQKLRDITLRTIDAQWNTLVQRVKDSGILESSIAVCDVSGSMNGPTFADGTCPMSSSIGLALLLAEVTEPPFGGAMITFSTNPHVLRVGGPDDKRTFQEKVKHMEQSEWGGSTDFIAVFEKLILPMAKENKLRQEDMVKNIFVFSDMQFNSATSNSGKLNSSYERIKLKFSEAGYEMPRLIFWNLAGGRAGYGLTSTFPPNPVIGDDVAPKPVPASQEGTVLVSGYSQGMLKMFLDNGTFGEPEDKDEEVMDKDGEDEEVVVERVANKKKKDDPIAAVRKAIGHEAYRMLKVVD